MQWLAESVFPLAAAAVPLAQSHRNHNREMSIAAELHRTAIEQAADLHDASIRHGSELHNHSTRLAGQLHDASVRHSETLHSDTKMLQLKLHLQQLKQELKHHRQAMHIDVEAARRENLRDVWSQKSRKADTLLITTTLMFAAFFALVVEGVPEADTWDAVVTAYSGTLGAAFAALFACILFTMRYQARMAEYNIYDEKQHYRCGKAHVSFESYYTCHCAIPAKVANHTFLVGTVSLVLAATLLTFTRFSLGFNNYPAAIVFAGTTIGTMIALFSVLVFFPTRTRVHGKFSGYRTTLDALMENITQDPETKLMQPSRDDLREQLRLHRAQIREMENEAAGVAAASTEHDEESMQPNAPPSKKRKKFLKRLSKNKSRRRPVDERQVPSLLSQAVGATLTRAVGITEPVLLNHNSTDSTDGSRVSARGPAHSFSYSDSSGESNEEIYASDSSSYSQNYTHTYESEVESSARSSYTEHTHTSDTSRGDCELQSSRSRTRQNKVNVSSTESENESHDTDGSSGEARHAPIRDEKHSRFRVEMRRRWLPSRAHDDDEIPLSGLLARSAAKKYDFGRTTAPEAEASSPSTGNRAQPKVDVSSSHLDPVRELQTISDRHRSESARFSRRSGSSSLARSVSQTPSSADRARAKVSFRLNS